MRYQTKLLAAAACLLMSSLFASGIAYWGVEQSRYLLERSHLAHLQLESYLALSRHAYQAFQQVAEASLAGGRRYAGSEEPFIPWQRLQETIDRLRELIAREGALVSRAEESEEREELSRLALIETQARAAMEQLQFAEALTREGRSLEARMALKGSLSEAMDGWLGQLIENAVTDETEEVANSDRAAQQLLGRLSLTTRINALGAVLVTCAALFFLLRRLQRPLAQLMAGTRALAADDLSHRITITGNDEFAVLGQSFNRMANELEDKRLALQAAQADLEAKVAQRTEELERANRALERADRARRQFFADISHELRTPLTIIRGEAQVALRGQAKNVEDYQDSLRRIAEESRHLTRLVDDMLYMARESAHALPLQNTAVRLDELISRVCDQVQSIAAERQISIAFFHDCAGKTVLGDPVRLRQVFLILLDNAMRYSAPGNEVRIHVTCIGEYICVRVADQGMGIDPSELGHVFERFHRGAAARGCDGEGVGLGLPVAKAIIESHGGTISIESMPHQGTTVSVTLPIQQDVNMRYECAAD